MYPQHLLPGFYYCLFNIEQQTILVSLLKFYTTSSKPGLLREVIVCYSVKVCSLKRRKHKDTQFLYVRLEWEHHVFWMLARCIHLTQPLEESPHLAHWIRSQVKCFPQHKDMSVSSYSSLSLQKSVCRARNQSRQNTITKVLLIGLFTLKVDLPGINSLLSLLLTLYYNNSKIIWHESYSLPLNQQNFQVGPFQNSKAVWLEPQ